MKWSYILFLPAVVSIAWALATVTLKKRLTRAQVLMSLLLMMVGAAILVLGVFFRGRAGSLFIYDFLYECITVMCVPLFYVGICSLTEPRGPTLAQRRSFVPGLLFILGLTIGAFNLGPRRYEEMCHQIRDNANTWIVGDNAWNFMLFWDHWLFVAVVMIMGMALILASSRKVRIFGRRFNDLYAKDINAPKMNVRPLLTLAWTFLPLSVTTVLAIDLQPHNYKYWLIVLSVLLTGVQWLMGHFIYHLDYDARYLVQYVKGKERNA